MKSIQIWCKLFNHCFKYRINTLYFYLPHGVGYNQTKGSQYNPCIPLNYMGISLLPTMYKLYTSLMNNMLVLWLDDNDKFAEERNEFHQKRLYMEHLCSLTAIIRNMKNMKQSTPASFIDMKKKHSTLSIMIACFIKWCRMESNESCTGVLNHYTQHLYEQFN